MFLPWSALALNTVKVGDKVPFANLHWGFPPQMINTAQHVMGRSVLVVGLPGAFTPTWSNVQIPGYLEHGNELKELGIDEVLVFCVNDGAVMRAWNLDTLKDTEGSLLTFMGDPYADFTKACGMELTHPGPASLGLVGPRCKRFAMHVVNNIVQYVAVSESEDDPAGDDHPEATCAQAIIEAIEAGKAKEM
jgi:peroxiredoxin